MQGSNFYRAKQFLPFDALNGFREELYKMVDKDLNEYLPMILVGNTIGLEKERQVSYEEGKKLADEWGIDFFETSAKENINVKEVFECLTRRIFEGRLRFPFQQGRQIPRR